MIKKGIKTPVRKTPAKAKKPIKPQPQKSQREENKAIKKFLVNMRGKLIAEISKNLTPETLSAPTEIGDVIDQAGDERDRELSLLLTDRNKEKLLAINEALEKLKEGSYGICEECGEKIGAGRIKVIPLTKYCVNCQSRLEKELSLQRKAEEDLKYHGLAFAPTVEEEEA